MRRKLILLNVAAVVVLGGCGTSTDSAGSERPIRDVDAPLQEGAAGVSAGDLEGEWVPVMLFGEDLAPAPLRRVSVRFNADTDTVAARNGCNLYLGTFVLGEQGKFTVDWESITREACARRSAGGALVSDSYRTPNPEALDAAKVVQTFADRLEFIDAHASVVAAYHRP